MKKVYDDYRSHEIQGDCYKYIHVCPNCGKTLFEIREWEYNKHPEHVKIPKFCDECGTKQ